LHSTRLLTATPRRKRGRARQVDRVIGAKRDRQVHPDLNCFSGMKNNPERPLELALEEIVTM